MAIHFKTPRFEEAPACLYFEDLYTAKDIHVYLESHPNWKPLHDRVLAEFHTPLVALIWQGYIPRMPQAPDKMLEVYGVTLLTPTEVGEMIYAKKSQSFLNRKP